MIAWYHAMSSVWTTVEWGDVPAIRSARVVLPDALRPSTATTCARLGGGGGAGSRRETSPVSGSMRHGPAGGSPS